MGEPPGVWLRVTLTSSATSSRSSTEAERRRIWTYPGFGCTHWRESWEGIMPFQCLGIGGWPSVSRKATLSMWTIVTIT